MCIVFLSTSLLFCLFHWVSNALSCRKRFRYSTCSAFKTGWGSQNQWGAHFVLFSREISRYFVSPNTQLQFSCGLPLDAEFMAANVWKSSQIFFPRWKGERSWRVNETNCLRENKSSQEISASVSISAWSVAGLLLNPAYWVSAASATKLAGDKQYPCTVQEILKAGRAVADNNTAS